MASSDYVQSKRFAFGFAVGRMMRPAQIVHHYERFGDSPMIIDTTTGKVCDPRQSEGDVLDRLAASQKNSFPYCQISVESQDLK